MANHSTKQAKVINAEEVEALHSPIPESWKKAAGILRDRKINALKYQEQIRKEWDQRTQKLERLMRKMSRSK